MCKGSKKYLVSQPVFKQILKKKLIPKEKRKQKKIKRQKKTLCLRLVFYKDEQGRKYKFIANN
jgi:hypothetical protein